MLLWIVLAIGWLGVLALAVSLFRATAYADKKIRDLARNSEREDKAA
jgi:hypothetical protein